MKRQAFTLLELLLVLALITVISALGVASFQRQYARASFKNGVVGVQDDLNLARVLAMRSAEAYFFRYAPGTGIYEIAPLRTLQETIYRAHGEAENEELADPALGGSLATSSLDPNAGSFESRAFYDDLFSPQNIIADLREAGKLQEADARLGSTPVDAVGGLGGSLASTNAALGAPQSSDPFSLGVSDAYGQGAEFSLDQKILAGLATAREISVREMNVFERMIGKQENVLALRVNAHGLVVRKEARGGAIFTYERISESTPSNLKTERPKAAEATATSDAADPNEELLGAGLGGSLSAPPSSSTLSGVDPDESNPTPGFDDPFAADVEGESFSIWSEPIVFFPNGRTMGAVVGLANVGRYEYYSEIAVRSMTGYARVTGISAAPPGTDVGRTVLTQEQIQRLQNPSEYATAVSGQTTDPDGAGLGGGLGGGLGSDPTSASAGLAGTDAVGASPDLGADSLNGGFNNLGGLDSLGGLGADLGAGQGGQGASGFAPRYGSSEGRSGYRFNAGTTAPNPASNANAGLGVGVGGGGGTSPVAEDVGSTNLGAGLGVGGGTTPSAGGVGSTNLGAGLGGGGGSSPFDSLGDLGGLNGQNSLNGGGIGQAVEGQNEDERSDEGGNARNRGGAGR